MKGNENMARIDIYNLTASPQVPNISREEVALNDLALAVNPNSNAGIIKGNVTSGGSPVQDVTVKVLTTSYVPVQHASTNTQGLYEIPEVTQGTYLVTATKHGYLTSTPQSVSVTQNNPTTLDIILSPDPDAAKNLLDGRLSDTSSQYIDSAIVNIYQVSGGVNTLILTTNTNSAGQYLAPYLDDGNYLVEGVKLGYLPSVSGSITLSGGTKETLDLVLSTDAQTNVGTISGRVVQKGTTTYLANATVALYLVTGTTESVVQVTKTNSAGAYLFGDVLDGNYIVKAIEQTR